MKDFTVPLSDSSWHEETRSAPLNCLKIFCSCWHSYFSPAGHHPPAVAGQGNCPCLFLRPGRMASEVKTGTPGRLIGGRVKGASHRKSFRGTNKPERRAGSTGFPGTTSQPSKCLLTSSEPGDAIWILTVVRGMHEKILGMSCLLFCTL